MDSQVDSSNLNIKLYTKFTHLTGIILDFLWLVDRAERNGK